MVLLHGGGQTRYSWRGTGSALAAAGWDTLSMDMRGHGESSWSPTRDYRREALIADLVAVCSSMPTPPAVVGASLSGLTSLLTAGRHPAVMSALVLVDMTIEPELDGVDRVRDMLRATRAGWATIEEFGAAIGSRKSPPALRRHLREENGRFYWHWDPGFMDPGSEPYFWDLQDELTETARTLTMPTLLIWGRESEVVSQAAADRMRDRMPRAEYVDIAEAGHTVAGGDNDAFTAAVLSFLDRKVCPVQPSED